MTQVTHILKQPQGNTLDRKHIKQKQQQNLKHLFFFPQWWKWEIDLSGKMNWQPSPTTTYIYCKRPKWTQNYTFPLSLPTLLPSAIARGICMKRGLNSSKEKRKKSVSTVCLDRAMHGQSFMLAWTVSSGTNLTRGTTRTRRPPESLPQAAAQRY